MEDAYAGDLIKVLKEIAKQLQLLNEKVGKLIESRQSEVPRRQK
jgi:hypothetical protein